MQNLQTIQNPGHTENQQIFPNLVQEIMQSGANTTRDKPTYLGVNNGNDHGKYNTSKK